MYRKKNTWFNSQYSDTIKSNISKIFLKVFKHNFAKGRKFYKIFNYEKHLLHFVNPSKSLLF